MSIVLDNCINENNVPNKNMIINVYYTISHVCGYPVIVYYLKLNKNSIYDTFLNETDFYNIYRSPKFYHIGMIEHSGFYYKIIEVEINETLYKNIEYIVTATVYEIVNLGFCGKNRIKSHFKEFISENPCMYTLYDESKIVLNPWVFYKVIEKRYLDFLDLYGFKRDYDDNLPYFALSYKPNYNHNRDEVCVRIIVFMTNITMNYDNVFEYDIRKNTVYVSDKQNCKYFGR
jgi:hypothetical protein